MNQQVEHKVVFFYSGLTAHTVQQQELERTCCYVCGVFCGEARLCIQCYHNTSLLVIKMISKVMAAKRCSLLAIITQEQENHNNIHKRGGKNRKLIDLIVRGKKKKEI